MKYHCSHYKNTWNMEHSSLVHITLNICIHATDNCLIQELVFSKTRGGTYVLILLRAFSRNKTREFFFQIWKKMYTFFMNVIRYLICWCIYVNVYMFIIKCSNTIYMKLVFFLKDATFGLIEQLNIFNMLQYRPDPT